MNCTHCGTVLPPGALFCGECGRSVAESPKVPGAASTADRSRPLPRSAQSTPQPPARWVEDPVTGGSLVDEADEIDIEVADGAVRCEQCQSVMSSDDIFCGECGFVSRSITRAFRPSDFTGETRQLDVPPARPEVPEPIRAFRPDPEPELSPEPGPVPEEVVVPEPELPQYRPSPPPAPAPPAVPVARPMRSFRDAEDELDLEETRIVSRGSGSRFVLQFSTGESFTVHGSGLIGRNPRPEPGEFFDHLVRVLDSGKSVSKTHLEFGQEGGAFWVKDRFSGNGTIIREPEVSARRAEPDHRYRVARGSRIDIGEQFFVVS